MAAVDLDPDQVQALLAGCRFDLATVRRDLAQLDPVSALDDPAGARSLGGRLIDLVDRLEQAAANLEQAMRRLGRIPAPVPDGLAGEADRRAASSLQTVSALLTMQANRAVADEVSEALRNAGLQVRAVARVHESLRLAARLDGPPRSVELGAYVRSICDGFRPALAPASGGPVLRAYMTPLQVPPELARQVGLVVMELVSNALRHAFAPDRPGRIWVVGYPAPGGRYLLCVEDDGIGLPPEFDPRTCPDGTGLAMVNRLADQAKLSLTCHGDGGAWFILAVPTGRIRRMAGLA